MTPNIPLAVRHLIDEYRSFLRTSFRFLDEHLRRQFEEHLARADVVVKGPYVTLARDFALGRSLRELVQKGEAHPDLLQAHWPFGENRLYHHQEQAFRIGQQGRSFVITTGTGSGKTEAFLLPVLDGILRRKAEGIRGLQAIFVYPMNALANDQLERMRRLLRGSGLDISFALYTGDSDTTNLTLREEPAETERLTRADIRRHPPDILLTNYKQLDFLLVRKVDQPLFTPALRYLVFDEIHSYRGALATEIAWLIRRLKAQARLKAGQLVAIGTSATVTSAPAGAEALAGFASALFGEKVRPEDIICETYVPREEHSEPYTPALADLDAGKLSEFDPQDEAQVVALAEQLTGKRCPAEGPIAERVAAVLAGNRIVEALETFFAEPHTVHEAADFVRTTVPERHDAPLAKIRQEIEGYLLVGSVGDEDHPPRLRPKLHTFFHGVYDVHLCLDPNCRTLVPHGGSECPKCGSLAWPAALCRTCGQDFVKVRFQGQDEHLPVGSGDFFSDEHTAFLTHRIHDLSEGPGIEDAEETEEAEHQQAGRRRKRSRSRAEEKLQEVGVCPGCGRVVERQQRCPGCKRMSVPMLLHRGKLSTCPACGDIYPRGDIVTLLRTGTASTVSALATHHLDHLEGDNRKLLIFTDNRQDAAHQAGYTSDKHRTFALRHAMAHEIRQAGEEGVYLTQLPQRLFDRFKELGIIPSRPSRPEQKLWLDALAYQAANEITRYSRQRASLENLGLVAVEYEGLEELAQDANFTALAERFGLRPQEAMTLVRAILDVMRKNRAVAYDGRRETGTTLPFFTEYIDPAKKRRYRELEDDPYAVRFPDRDRGPKAFALDRPDHLRQAGRIMGFFQENPRVGQLTATQKVVARLLGNREDAEAFLRAVVPLLLKQEILFDVTSRFPLPAKERTSRLRILQIDPRRIRLRFVDQGYRCNACQTWRPYGLATCPTPKCQTGRLVPSSLDWDNYYVRLYLERPPRRFAVAEHSAQISGDARACREKDFKDGKLDALVCTPTLELGVDIGPLLTVVLRNAPPTPANYAQRVGRAGRRLRIGFVSTFCASSAHDRHAFERPEWFVAGRFDPPRLRLDNPKIVFRHLRSYLLAQLDNELPNFLKELLDDVERPTRWKRQELQPLFQEIRTRRDQLVRALLSVTEQDRQTGQVARYGEEDVKKLVDDFDKELTRVLERWWQRIEQLDREYRAYSAIGSPRQDEKKAAARKRAYRELTEDPERAYILNYLATQQVLPAYQFPLDTFSLDPGVSDTPTIYRAAAIAIEEFAPGNYVYANGHKLRSIRVLYPGGHGTATHARSDAEASGRLEAFHFCPQCDEAVESGRNTCPRCETALGPAVDVVFVDAFEAEENLRITSEEESRQRLVFDRREYLIAEPTLPCRLYPYALHPVELLSLAEILVTNWGALDSRLGEGRQFWLCPDCGRHLPYEPSEPTSARHAQRWRKQHARFCKGEPKRLVLAHRFQADCLVLSVPGRQDTQTVGRQPLSPTVITLAEALRAGAARLLQLEPDELGVFVRRWISDSPVEQIVFYETVPGGAGYLEEMAERLPEVARATQDTLYGHDCSRACYLCLKHYRNQTWHALFDKNLVRDILVVLAGLDSVVPQPASYGASRQKLVEMLQARLQGSDETFRRYPKGEIEEILRGALQRLGISDFQRDFEIPDGEGRLLTVPDFAWPELKVAVYCDGYAYHAAPETLELDAKKRNQLQLDGWLVLTFWGRTIHKDPESCARQVQQALAARRKAGPHFYNN